MEDKDKDKEMEGRIATRVKAIVEEKRLRWEKEIEETFASALDNRDEDQLVDLRVFAAKNAIITLKIGKMAGYGVYSEYLEDPSAQVNISHTALLIQRASKICGWLVIVEEDFKLDLHCQDSNLQPLE